MVYLYDLFGRVIFGLERQSDGATNAVFSPLSQRLHSSVAGDKSPMSVVPLRHAN